MKYDLTKHIVKALALCRRKIRCLLDSDLPPHPLYVSQACVDKGCTYVYEYIGDPQVIGHIERLEILPPGTPTMECGSCPMRSWVEKRRQQKE